MVTSRSLGSAVRARGRWQPLSASGPSPGFPDHPMVVEDDRHPGFFLVDNEVDKDHWPEGFRTERV